MSTIGEKRQLEPVPRHTHWHRVPWVILYGASLCTLSGSGGRRSATVESFWQILNHHHHQNSEHDS